MSIFDRVLNNASNVEHELLGPDYPYYKNIKTPKEIGMSSDGNLKTLGNDISGLISYVEVLVSGKSNASKTGGPLGNKFFLQTGGKCAVKGTCSDPDDPSTCQQTDRFIYVNNVPNGNIPFISSGLGVNFTEFEGLIPGAIGNLGALNPFGILGAFTSGATPECQEVTLQTVDANNNTSNASHYLTTVDLTNMDPCNFPNGVNNFTNPASSCRQTFTNRVDTNAASVSLPQDPLAQIYFASLAFVGIYVVYRLMEKSR
jgi:hypothetical protein